MSKRAEMANTYHEKGYSCAQAVACAFSDVIGLPEEKIAALLSGFGGGFRSGEICGVLSGAITVLGAKWPHAVAEDQEAKEFAAEKAREFQRRWREKFPEVRCEPLNELPCAAQQSPTAMKLGLEKNCAVYITAAAEIVEQMLSEG
ncbi:MAG: C_GCAxxG_C_C family protein [Oscillospiraceae bacterium]|nr:C_GCAxxG_C_C family protein [Oscillospiraceae bacterium]